MSIPAHYPTNRLCSLGKVFGLGICLLLCGCRQPSWCAFRALNCLPASADQSAPRYWEQCPSDPAATVSRLEAGAEAGSTAARPPVAPPETPRLRAQLASVARPSEALPGDAQNTKPSSSETSRAAMNSASVPTKQPSPFQLPAILPGADTPPLSIPSQLPSPQLSPQEREAAERQRAEAFAQLYPSLPPAPLVPEASGEPERGTLDLDQLQQLTRENHPGIRAAAAAVETARGLMIQAGLPPNPNLGYEADTVRTAFTNGYQGGYLSQTIITARKLGLAAEAAAVDHVNAHLSLQKEWYAAISEVRRQYFNTLSARQRLQLAEALYQLSERAYATQIDLVRAGEAAPYEPLQLRVLTTQARATLIHAQQESLAAWRSLAAAVGIPALPPTALAGRIDCKVPEIDYETALARMLFLHTDLRTARNLVGKNRTLVTLADRTPIPDINAGVVVQHDDTFNPGTTTYNLVLGGAIPIFDRNQGNRVAARAELVRVSQSVADTQNQLIAQLAPVFANYQANRQLAASFRTDALRDQVRAYRGIYQRYHTDPSGIGFNDIIVAQQTLASTLTQYLSILQAQWQGTVDVAGLLQVDDIFQLGPLADVAEIPVVIEEADGA